MPPSRKIRAIVADDSTLTRRALCRMLEADPEIEVIAVARDGIEAVEKARDLRPDIITLDINMPRQDGLKALEQILAERICPSVVVSSLTQRSAEVTIEALTLGAFDCVAKPDGNICRDFSSVSEDLIRKVKAAVQCGIRETSSHPEESLPESIPDNLRIAEGEISDGPEPTRAIAIGISTGGPTSIQRVLPRFPADLDAAVFLVQHMPPNFTSTFSKRLAAKCPIRVVEAQARQAITAGTCYVGQGGRHLVPYRRSDGKLTMRCPTQPQSLFVPSVDVMIRAVTKAFGAENTIGVIMTGIGHDGAEALLELKQAGGYTIAESEETAVVYGMPRAAFENGGTCEVLPNYQIAEAVISQLAAL